MKFFAPNFVQLLGRVLPINVLFFSEITLHIRSNFAIAHRYFYVMLHSVELFPNLLGKKLEVELHKTDT